MVRSIHWKFKIVGLTAMLTACSGGSSSAIEIPNTTSDASTSDTSVNQFYFSVTPTIQNIKQKSSIAVPVQVSRTSNLTEKVEITAENLPTGITAGAVTIPATSTTGLLNLVATENVKLDSYEIQLKGTCGTFQSSAKFTLRVGGLPGTLDKIFGLQPPIPTEKANPGIIVDNIATNRLLGGEANAVTVQNDGKILVAGDAAFDANRKMIAIRYNNNGTRDTSFNKKGSIPAVVEVAHSGQGASHGILVQKDGKIVLAGGCSELGSTYQACLARFNTNGTKDTSFGTDGLTQIKVGVNAEIYSVVLTPEGRMFGAGTYAEERAVSGKVVQDRKIAVFAIKPSGGLDLAYNQNSGRPETGMYLAEPIWKPQLDPSQFVINERATSIALQSDKKIIVAAGSIQKKKDVSVLLRLNADGSLDRQFGDNGIFTVKIPNNADYQSVRVSHIVLDAANKLYVSGTSDGTGWLARMDTQNQLDSTFNGTGYIQFAPENPNSGINSFAIQPDGAIVTGIASTRIALGNAMLSVGRFLSNGNYDVTFGNAGLSQFNFEEFPVSVGRLALQPDGKILILSRLPSGFMLTRLWP